MDFFVKVRNLTILLFNNHVESFDLLREHSNLVLILRNLGSVGLLSFFLELLNIESVLVNFSLKFANLSA